MGSSTTPKILIATRGSALALAQSNLVLAECRRAFPEIQFEIRIIKTTGDQLQTASLASPDGSATKGLFTKELEVALLNHEADLAVHSLKDLPTELPAGLELAAVCPRADVRDVLLYRAAGSAQRGFQPGLNIAALPEGATVATSSTRRQAQLLALRPDLKIVPIRGNVGTRLLKLAEQAKLDALILAAAGLNRLRFRIAEGGQLLAPPGPSAGPTPPEGLLATLLEPEVMLPCVGQAAIGIESRARDGKVVAICQALNHPPTSQCVTAERSFLRTMGGGCQSPVAALADLQGPELRLRAVSFRAGPAKRAESRRPVAEATALGAEVARRLLG